MGLPILWGEAPRTAQELAAATGTHEDALYRLLRFLASDGVFAEDHARRLTPPHPVGGRPAEWGTRFPTKLAGAKVVLVMGHSACGAVAGAIAAQLGNLTQLLAKLQPAIQATAYTGERTADNAAFVDAVARKNVELTMANIRKHSQVIAELEQAGAVKIHGAFYDLKTGAVEFFA